MKKILITGAGTGLGRCTHRHRPGPGRTPGHRHHGDLVAGDRTAGAHRGARPSGPRHSRQARRPGRPRHRGCLRLGLRHLRQQCRDRSLRAAGGGLGPYCVAKHALEAIAATLRDELAPTGITVQTVNPGAYLTGFNDRIADTDFRWLDDAVNFNRTEDVRARFADILADQFEPQDMIDRMVEIIGAEQGKYRNVWPPATEELIREVQEAAWTREV
ncbi:SDR family NAD(P)-dependent oxidoreductase [Streptomyces sp. NPDC001502]|uniref:SDR family NAD(P)-dependent oxidoreductase n=1 Tax=Streptomyces sp. NPDC001502 TaxID=3364578 RepID=UPI0036A4C9DF